jgi:hypothetical protein
MYPIIQRELIRHPINILSLIASVKFPRPPPSSRPTYPATPEPNGETVGRSTTITGLQPTGRPRTPRAGFEPDLTYFRFLSLPAKSPS